MKMSPMSSTATPRGESRRASVATDSSQDVPATPVPATVEITPAGFTLRMAWLAVSAIKRLPAESVAQALGVSNWAKRAAPSSPALPREPLPAAVCSVPPGARRRTRWLLVSTMYRLPVRSAHTARGARNCATSGPVPSGLAPPVPVPATVRMARAGVTSRTR